MEADDQGDEARRRCRRRLERVVGGVLRTRARSAGDTPSCRTAARNNKERCQNGTLVASLGVRMVDPSRRSASEWWTRRVARCQNGGPVVSLGVRMVDPSRRSASEWWTRRVARRQNGGPPPCPDGRPWQCIQKGSDGARSLMSHVSWGECNAMSRSCNTRQTALPSGGGVAFGQQAAGGTQDHHPPVVAYGTWSHMAPHRHPEGVTRVDRR